MCLPMIRLLVLQGIMSAVLLVLAGFAMVAGAFGPAPHAVLQASRCELPCWQDIRPGESLITDAFRTLTSQRYSPRSGGGTQIRFTPPPEHTACRAEVHYWQTVVIETRLSRCPGLRLGDLLLLLGAPEQVAPNLLTLDFDGGAVRAQLHLLECDQSLSPHTPVQFVSLTQPPPDSAAMGPAWQGFALPWRYTRALPNIVLLGCQ